MIFNVNGTYHFTPEYDFFVKKKTIKSIPQTFYEKLVADDAIIAAIAEGKFTFPKPDGGKKLALLNVISDDLGVQGIRNHADGKQYDSKSKYRKALKAAGCIEVGTEKIPDKPREQRGDYDSRQDIANAMNQLGL